MICAVQTMNNIQTNAKFEKIRSLGPIMFAAEFSAEITKENNRARINYLFAGKFPVYALSRFLRCKKKSIHSETYFCLWRSPDHGMVSVVVVVVVVVLLLVGATFVLSDLWGIQKNL